MAGVRGGPAEDARCTPARRRLGCAPTPRARSRTKGASSVSESPKPPVHERWAHLRFSVVGPLLAAPPAHGELQAALEALAATSWLHPITGAQTQFGVSTIERWYHQARGATIDPVGVLRRKRRSDAGQQAAVGESFRTTLLEQYAEQRSSS